MTADTPEEEFVKWREGRDSTLTPPALIFPSLNANIRAGELPPAEDNGIQYFKFPLNLL